LIVPTFKRKILSQPPVHNFLFFPEVVGKSFSRHIDTASQSRDRNETVLILVSPITYL